MGGRRRIERVEFCVADVLTLGSVDISCTFALGGVEVSMAGS